MIGRLNMSGVVLLCAVLLGALPAGSASGVDAATAYTPSPTSPFVDVAGKRIFQREAGERLLQDMREAREFISERGLFADEAERRRVLEVYAEGTSDLTERVGKLD